MISTNSQTAEVAIGSCLISLQKTYIELLENADSDGVTEIGRTLRHYVTNLAYIAASNNNDEEVCNDEEEEEEGDFDFQN